MTPRRHASLSTLSTLSTLAAGVAIAACSAAPSPANGDADLQEDDGSQRRDETRYERDGSVYDSSPPVGAGLGVLRFMPSTIYSGFDGTHSFKAPIAVYDAADDLTVTADDPSAAELSPAKLARPSAGEGADSGTYFLVTPRRAGAIKLIATSRGRSTTATVEIAAYDPDRWTAGEARYANGGNGEPPCTRCHAGGRAIDHSPATMASATDQQIGLIITTGIKPGPTPIADVDCDDCSPLGKQHRWSVSDAEKTALVTFLRSLEPRGFE